MSLKNQRQPLNTFFAQNVEPFQKSTITLSGGFDKPFYYSLGNQSTVPFVRLQGSGGTQKEFTWGETIEVLPGQNVQVESASYMAGDIQIQSGRDIANKPARISVPIKVLPDVDSFQGLSTAITPVFPCDCRGARRAYLGLYFYSGPTEIGSVNFRVMGFNKQHSWPGRVDPLLSDLPPTGKKYITDYQLETNTFYTMLPLGLGALLADPTIPMTLADYATWRFDHVTVEPGNVDLINTFFYTLEYL